MYAKSKFISQWTVFGVFAYSLIVPNMKATDWNQIPVHPQYCPGLKVRSNFELSFSTESLGVSQFGSILWFPVSYSGVIKMSFSGLLALYEVCTGDE